MEVKTTNSGHKYMELTPQEAFSVGMGTSEGCICMCCNDIIIDTVYYVPVLNDCMCKECFDKWSPYAKYYSEDEPVESRNFKYYYDRLHS